MGGLRFTGLAARAAAGTAALTLGLLVSAVVLAACTPSNTGALTGRVAFVGRVPPQAYTSTSVEVVRGQPPVNQVVVAQQKMKAGQPYMFTLPAGRYFVRLVGNVIASPFNNRVVVRAGQTTHRDLAVVFHGTAP